MSYRIVPIGRDLADFVRTHRKAPGYGHAASVETATGTGPCRQCLRTSCRSSWRASVRTPGACVASPAEPGRLDAAIRALLDDGAIEHLNIRNAEAGCFVARVERQR